MNKNKKVICWIVSIVLLVGVSIISYNLGKKSNIKLFELKSYSLEDSAVPVSSLVLNNLMYINFKYNPLLSGGTVAPYYDIKKEGQIYIHFSGVLPKSKLTNIDIRIRDLGKNFNNGQPIEDYCSNNKWKDAKFATIENSLGLDKLDPKFCQDFSTSNFGYRFKPSDMNIDIAKIPFYVGWGGNFLPVVVGNYLITFYYTGLDREEAIGTILKTFDFVKLGGPHQYEF